MSDSWAWLSAGAGNVLLAILAGAGGSALLELLWRPRRDRRRAAVLLTAEVALNTELLILQAHVRQQRLMEIPADLRMSSIAWTAASGLISELPADDLRELVLLYNQYDALNRHVAAFGVALDEYRNAVSGSSVSTDAETMVLRIVDVFNIGLDATLKRGQKILPKLATTAGIKETSSQGAVIPQYAQITAEHMANRKAHLEALRTLKNM